MSPNFTISYKLAANSPTFEASQISDRVLEMDLTWGPVWWRSMPCNRGASDLEALIQEVLEAPPPKGDEPRHSNKGMKYGLHPKFDR